jgi:D-alanine-D-alanine ligase
MNIGVMFGSRSVEHDVAITSAYGVMKGLEKIWKYDIYPIYVSRSGKWIYDKKLIEINAFKDFDEKNYIDQEVKIVAWSQKKLILEVGKKGWFSKPEMLEIDFVFPIFHGVNGEDGSIQGLLDMLQVPYMWPSISGSAIGMNKVIMKNMFKSLSLPITKYLVFKKWEEDIQAIESTIPYPLIVKPANLWSSIGISKVTHQGELKNALEVAFHYDQHAIIEECVPNLMELNCSVSEKDGEIITSLVEQPVSTADFLSFEEKYIASDGGTMQWLKNKVRIPAEIPDELTKKIQEYSKIIYAWLFCNGWAPRIDYLYDKVAQKLYVNEINTIPWALQMHLWVKSDMSVTALLENLMAVGFQKAKEKEINIDFQSNIIGHTIDFMK